jgi:Rieske Fe-S protein
MEMNTHAPGCAGCDIGRRTFLVQSAIVAAAAALAACGGADSMAPNISAGTIIKVSDFPALANVGGIATTNVGGAPLAVVRTGTTSFVVLSRICPHQGSIVNVNGPGFFCPNHGAQFDETGKWKGGQPTSNMHAYANSYDASTQTLTIS